MSKASEWAKRQPRQLYLRQIGSPYTVNVFMVVEKNGVPGMRIHDSGPFAKRDALRLARWILDTFGEEP